MLKQNDFLRKRLDKYHCNPYLCYSFFIVLDCKVYKQESRRETALLVFAPLLDDYI